MVWKENKPLSYLLRKGVRRNAQKPKRPSLEVEFGPNLHLTCPGRSIILANLRRGISEIYIADIVIWFGELGTVKEIIELKTKLEVDNWRLVHGLRCRLLAAT